MDNLSFDLAFKAVNYALDLSKNHFGGRPLTVAVCDKNGFLLAFAKMDGAKPLTIELTKRKAYTAAHFGIPTAKFLERLQKENLDVGYFADAQFSPMPGGVPVSSGNNVIGAVAVGGISVAEDVEAAEMIAAHINI